jgi:hypothetical protein
MSIENSLVQYSLYLKKEGGCVRYSSPGNGLRFLGGKDNFMKISSLQVVIDQNEEYLLVKIPLHRVEIISEPSEPLDIPDNV